MRHRSEFSNSTAQWWLVLPKNTTWRGLSIEPIAVRYASCPTFPISLAPDSQSTAVDFVYMRPPHTYVHNDFLLIICCLYSITYCTVRVTEALISRSLIRVDRT